LDQNSEKADKGRDNGSYQSDHRLLAWSPVLVRKPVYRLLSRSLGLARSYSYGSSSTGWLTCFLTTPGVSDECR